MGDFDSSDEEFERNQENLEPLDDLRVDWVNVPRLGLCNTLALSSLPGCRFREHKRNLRHDVATIVSKGVTDVLILLTHAELRKYRTPTLLTEFDKNGLTVHHYTLEDGAVPSLEVLVDIVTNLENLVINNHTVLIHCYGGLGRTCLVAAALMLTMDPHLEPEAAIQFLRNIRGPRAVQTVRQYNMIHEYRGLVQQAERGRNEFYEDRSRSASR